MEETVFCQQYMGKTLKHFSTKLLANYTITHYKANNI